MAAIKGVARVLVAAGSAKPSPALGQALGPLGVNMMEFCKDFNAKTSALKTSAVMRVRLTAFEDRTFKYSLMAPSSTWFLKRVTGLEKGAATPGKEVVGTVSVKAIYEIAKSKQAHDVNLAGMDTEAVAKCIAASAKSMGLKLGR
jgi:large subunit ribosomal protein L11